MIFSSVELIPNILFLCKGSVQDGLGHVMRSRTVLESTDQKYATKMLVIGDSYIDNLLKDRDIDYEVIDTELDVKRIINEFIPKIIIFDLLALSEDLIEEISKNRFTVSLSPIFNGLNGVDLIIHRSKILGKDWPIGLGKPKIVSGLDYVVVNNNNCKPISENSYKHNLGFPELSLAISMGGTDAPNKTLKVLQKVKQAANKLLIWVLLGEGYGHSYDKIVNSIHGTRHEIILAKSNDSFWRVLSTCSLAVLSGGMTAYEAAFAGIPSINLLENRRNSFLLEELVDSGVSYMIEGSQETELDQLLIEVDALADNRDALLDMHLRSKGLIDGLGATRIVHKIIQEFKKIKSMEEKR